MNGRRILISLVCAALALPAPIRANASDTFQEIVIQPGDTLWSISNRYLKDPRKWPDIVKANNLQSADPTVALPGTRLKIPVVLIKEEFRTVQVISVIPEVRYRSKEGSDWKEATRDTTLRYDDNLRTMKGAQARVRFPTKEVVQINENSYVVLKPEKILQQIQLMAGDVRASRARVIMPQGTIVEPKAGVSDYQAKIREDKTEVVFVYKGNVDVTAQGKTVTVREGYGTQVPKSAPPSAPMPFTNFHTFIFSQSDTLSFCIITCKIRIERKY
jgi:LysM repeat protein